MKKEGLKRQQKNVHGVVEHDFREVWGVLAMHQLRQPLKIPDFDLGEVQVHKLV